MSQPVTLTYSASSESAWRDCPRKWWWSHYRGFRPAIKAEALATGIRWHELLEDYWQRGLVRVALVSDPDTHREAKLAAMMAGYAAHYPADERPELIAVEQRFEIPLMDHQMQDIPGWTLLGYLDALVQIGDEIWIVESKTCGEDISPGADYWKRLYLDPQISTYWIGARSLGYDVAGILYDVARKPDLRPLTATPLSSRKYTKATKDKPSALYANQRETDETPAEYYARCLDAIQADPSRYFRREPVRRLVSQVEQHMHSMASFARQMSAAVADDFAPQNPSSCNRFGQCQYWNVCCAGPTATPLDIPGEFTTREERGSSSEPARTAPAIVAEQAEINNEEEDWF